MRQEKGSEVTAETVSKSFGGFHALRAVSLEIKKGEFFSLLGPSGCGKTTLLRIIAGFEEPSSGDVRLDGSSVIRLPPNKRHVNTVFQSYALFPHLSVFENIAFPLRIRKVPENQILGHVREYLELVRLEKEEKKLPSQLSGGQRQRVAIARALINHPSVLLLDEPLSALDAKLRQHMLIELDSIHDQIGITFIYVTHDQAEAISVSDRVAVMNEGRIEQIGTPAQIYEAPASRFVAEFIGETNLMRGTVIEVSDLATVQVEGLGTMVVSRDKPMKIGDRVCLTIRPERIGISKDKPADLPKGFNCLSGCVEELIYSGFQTKYFVHVGESTTLRSSRQHAAYFTEESAIRWKEPVHLWWNADDGFIVEVEGS